MHSLRTHLLKYWKIFYRKLNNILRSVKTKTFTFPHMLRSWDEDEMSSGWLYFQQTEPIFPYFTETHTILVTQYWNKIKSQLSTEFMLVFDYQNVHLEYFLANIIFYFTSFSVYIIRFIFKYLMTSNFRKDRKTNHCLSKILDQWMRLIRKNIYESDRIRNNFCSTY